ncbi:DUF935 domain-containing protein [Novosphingobium sp. JCM 18896]|uniref:DUF935 domain-containing protein n=1 Tax=Novosphingobium sp. JCM 18896 TaxID=2989731 RepID=UPI0022235578|nr:DUF935 domain-containing protein [Novosphingobium sp. JCM 18896]MCW1428611.1 DUF935 domain-containing protein [Novosphingobium sp. JCM 18896]
MSETKRTKGSSTRRAAGREAVDVLEKGSEPAVAAADATDLDDILGELGVAVPVETLDGLDDILGEILPPPLPPAVEDSLDDMLGEIAPSAVAPVDDLDDLLGEIAPPAPAEPIDDLDDLLGEIAPAEAADAPVEAVETVDYVMGKVVPPAPAPVEDLDDLLGEIAPPAAEPVDALDDLLGEIAPPAAAEPVDALDDLLGEIAPPAAAEPVDVLDDLLGEIAPLAPAEPVDALDDLLGEIAPPAAAEPVASLDDLLGEIAPLAAPEAAESLDDILGELAPLPPAAPVDDLDDLLGELAPLPASADFGESLDDLLGEVAPVVEPAATAKTKAKGGEPSEPVMPEAEAPAPLSDDFSAMLDEMTAAMPEPVAEEAEPAEAEVAEEGEDGPKKPGIVTKLRALAGTAVVVAAAPFKGKREISRMTFAGMIASIGVLGTVVVGQTTYIIARPSGVVHHAPEPAPARTIVPVDYSKVDMTLYHDKIRSLPEGGRDMLRNPAIKEAVLNLDNGEMLHEELRELAQGNAAADRVDIRDDRVTISSCEGMICPAKSFKLVYRLETEDAVVCISERTGEGLPLSYSYGPDGYHEWPSCEGVH